MTLRVPTVEMSLQARALIHDNVTRPPININMNCRALELLCRELTADILTTRWLELISEYAQFVLITQRQLSLVEGRGFLLREPQGNSC